MDSSISKAAPGYDRRFDRRAGEGNAVPRDTPQRPIEAGMGTIAHLTTEVHNRLDILDARLTRVTEPYPPSTEERTLPSLGSSQLANDIAKQILALEVALFRLDGVLNRLEV